MGFELCWWDVAAVLVEPPVVEPVDPFSGGVLEVVEGAPGCLSFDQLGLVQAVDRLGEGVVIGRPTAPTEGWIPAAASRSP